MGSHTGGGDDSSLDEEHDPHSPTTHDVYLPPEQGPVVPQAAHGNQDYDGSGARADEQHHHHHKASRLREFFRKMRHLGHHHDHGRGHRWANGDDARSADSNDAAGNYDSHSLSNGSGSSDDVSVANGGDTQSLEQSGSTVRGPDIPRTATGSGEESGPSNGEGGAESNANGGRGGSSGGGRRRRPSTTRTSSRQQRRQQRRQTASTATTPAASVDTSPSELRRRPRAVQRSNTHPRTTSAPTRSARDTSAQTASASTGTEDTRGTADDAPQDVKVFDEATEPQVSGSVRLSRDKRELVDIKGLPNMWAEYARFKARKLLVLFGISLAAHTAVAFVMAVLLRVLFPSTLMGPATLPLPHGQQQQQEQPHATFFQLLYHTFVCSVAGTSDSGLVRDPDASVGAVLLVTNVYSGFVLRCLAVLGIVYLSTAMPPYLVFSKWAAVTSKSLTGLRSLEFRLVNQFGFEREMLDARARVTLSITPRRNPTRRRFFPLRLVRDTQAVMPVMWTVSHVIDHTSPLYDQDASSLEENMVLLEVVVDCVDPVSRQRMYHRHTYGAANILFHAEFATVADTSRFPDKAFLDFTKFHRVYQHAQ